MLVFCCFSCFRSKKGHALRGLAGTLERASDRLVPGWDGAWLDFGKALRRLALPIDWEFTPEQVCYSGELARPLLEGCFSYEDPYMRVTALCWGLASAYRLAVDHSQRVEAKTGNETIPSRTHDVSVPSTGDGVQTQHEANVVSETQTQPETNTALVCSVETQTQATTPRITIARVKTKKAWMKETIKLTESPPQLEHEEEEEEEEADEGAAAREEGVTAREERVVTVEEEASTREEEVVTGDGAHPMRLGARLKESRGMSRERKEMEQATQDRITLDEWYSEYIRKFPEEEKRRSARSHHPKEEPSLPLQTQPSLGGVSPSLHARPTFEGIDDWGRSLSQHLKDYSLPPRCERARSLSPQLERGRSSSLQHGRLRSPLPRSEQHRSSSSRREQSPPLSERARKEVRDVPRKSGRVKTQVERIIRGRDGQEIMRESEITRSLTPKEIWDI
ncbi:hypothetical protein WISP_75831 [Willisornis vidua]|uniref:Uncharacterized protein n=1 Tax=Willisornis vidua TaxID=1566151 RepID=A0ABQ9DC41_9PASS|nr:hypothetical protein WISP_75831 [Willisornis vidua]